MLDNHMARKMHLEEFYHVIVECVNKPQLLNQTLYRHYHVSVSQLVELLAT